MSRQRPRGAASFLVLALLVASPGPALAAAGAEPDWPCVQRLVPELAAGQMWSGEPPLDALPADARLAPALEPFPARLASRSQPVETAMQDLREALAGLPEGERAAQRALLFRETLALINAERRGLIGGIRRYAQRQRQLAERITAEGRQLSELRRDSAARPEAVNDLSEARRWDMRVFDDRQRALTQLCDQPVRLEQRAFALARMIQDL